MLLRAYRTALLAHNWTTQGGDHPIGGATADDTQEHFCARFQVNACRQVALLTDPEDKLPGVPSELREVFSVGQLCVLDIACGAGAATLGLLCTLASMRAAGQVACLPLNVSVRAADISPSALALFRELTEQVLPELRGVGIELALDTVSWDGAVPTSTRDLLDEFWTHTAQRDALVVIAQISGAAGKKEDYEPLRLSFEQIKMRTVEKGTLLWTEPGKSNSASWLMKKVSEFLNLALTRKEGILRFEIEYRWFDPFQTRFWPCRIALLLVPRRSANG